MGIPVRVFRKPFDRLVTPLLRGTVEGACGFVENGSRSVESRRHGELGGLKLKGVVVP